MSDTIEVFISYSKADKELRDGLLAHLRPLERQGVITWSDRQILPGTRWDDEIKARLNAADIILLLLSADFLNTDYCIQVEIPEALRRHEAGEATVMPVILRSCGWKYTPLAAIQAYPEKAKPIKSWTDIDEAYTNVVDAVHLAAKEIQKRRSQQRKGAVEQAILRQELRMQQAIEAEAAKQQQELERQQQEQLQREAAEKQRQAVEQERQRWEAEQLRQQQAEAERRRQQELAAELASEKGVDYTRLRDLLKAGKWKEADQETADRMLEVMGRQQQGWLDIEDIQQFPCTDLRTIDRLWVTYSKGQFGFSVQKQIWQECESPIECDASVGKFPDVGKFGNRVGWRRGVMKKDWIGYSGVTYDTSAPKGHLPSVGICRGWFLGRWAVPDMWVLRRCWNLFSRAQTCKLWHLTVSGVEEQNVNQI